MARATIKDVAKAAGVSPATVSRVYARDPSASEDVTRRVRAAATKLGYRPSMMARSLTQSHTNLVSLVVGSLQNPFDAAFVEKLSVRLSEAGKRLLVIPADEGAGDDGAPMVALDYQSDALIIAAGLMSRETCRRFARLNVPVIVLGRLLEEPGVDSILGDNFGGGARHGDLFGRLGYHRVAILRRLPETFSDDERSAGFHAGLAGRARVVEAATAEADAFRTATSMLSSTDRPEAVFCANDAIALHLLEAARCLNIRVPDDLAVVGFDNIPQSAWPSFQLTTIDLPIDPIVDWIVARHQARIDTPGLETEIKRIPVTPVLRATTPRIDAVATV